MSCTNRHTSKKYAGGIGFLAAFVVAFALVAPTNAVAEADAVEVDSVQVVVEIDHAPFSTSHTKATGNSKGNKVSICHIPPGNPSNAHTIEVSRSAMRAHLAHGDFLGDCPEVSGDDDDSSGSGDGDSGDGDSGDGDSGDGDSGDGDSGDGDSGDGDSGDGDSGDGDDDDGDSGDGDSGDGDSGDGDSGDGDDDDDWVPLAGDDDDDDDDDWVPPAGDDDDDDDDWPPADEGTDGGINPFSLESNGPCAHLFEDGAPAPGFYVIASGNQDDDGDYSHFYRGALITPDCRILGPPAILHENALE